MMLNLDHCKEFLEEKVVFYNNPSFITLDPIKIPHSFTRKEDIEIAAFLSATIAWGQRPTIIKNALKLTNMMSGGPYDFVCNFNDEEADKFLGFKHRTFNGFDVIYFLNSLKNIYNVHGGLESAFLRGYTIESSVFDALQTFRKLFFEIQDPGRTGKHISNVNSNSAAKRLNMFLRWMVRNDDKGVDFGLWKSISPADLMMPLDVHSGNTARKLGLLRRKQNDWKAVEELTENLRTFDRNDPIKYDFALFGLGVFEKF